jgi:uncharacterized protein YrrD
MRLAHPSAREESEVAMIRASGLYGRAVIDLDTAERIGRVDELIVDPYAPCVAAYVVARRPTFAGRKRFILPVEAIEAVGPDAITIRTADQPPTSTPHLDALPRFSELTGRKMVSFGGRLLGSVFDALIDERNGRIVGYPLEHSRAADWIESLFGFGSRSESSEYVRADAALRVGARLIVVPDDAIASTDEIQLPLAPEITAPTPVRHGEAAQDVLSAHPGQAADATGTSFALLLAQSDGLNREVDGNRRDDDLTEDPWAGVDHDGDTGLLSAMSGRRPATRRPQAVKVR